MLGDDNCVTHFCKSLNEFLTLSKILTNISSHRAESASVRFCRVRAEEKTNRYRMYISFSMIVHSLKARIEFMRGCQRSLSRRTLSLNSSLLD